jgi:acyl carrier protein
MRNKISVLSAKVRVFRVKNKTTMGLELAELILEIQERYAIELEDDDFANMRTFGGLIDTVKRKIDRPLDPATNETGKEIILQSLLAELRARLPKNVEINEDTRSRTLGAYLKQCDAGEVIRQRFPELPSWVAVGYRREYRGDWLNILSFWGVMIAMFVIVAIAMKYFGENIWSFLIAAVPCLGIALVWLFLIVLRVPYRTLRDVAHVIAEKRQTLLKVHEYSADDIENELREYMSKAFALKPEKIRRESDLVKDLGLG